MHSIIGIKEMRFQVQYSLHEDDVNRMDAELFGKSVVGLERSLRLASKQLYGNGFSTMPKLEIEGNIQRGSILVSFIENCNIGQALIGEIFLNSYSLFALLRFLKNMPLNIAALLPDGKRKIITNKQ